MTTHPRIIAPAEIIAVARRWIGTPYHHQASLAGVGTDCLGLIRGVLLEVGFAAPVALPAYSRDWAEAEGAEHLLDGARHHLRERALGSEEPGDILIFRWRPGMVAKHTAILSSPTTMIHAVEGAAVHEAPYARWWRRRLAGVFAL